MAKHLLFDFLEDHHNEIRSGHWDELEVSARDEAAPHLPADYFGQLQSIDWDTWGSQIEAILREARSKADALGNVTAFYWEFDVENEWLSLLSLCQSFDPPGREWTGDFVYDLQCPGFVELGNLFEQYGGFRGSKQAEASSMLLVIKTFCFFARLYRSVDIPYPGAMDFHDHDDPIVLQG